MPDELNGRDLIADFLDAVRLRHLDQCQEILEALEALSDQQPVFKPWCRYMHGSLAFERHRWAEAERIFTELLQVEPEPELHARAMYTLGRSLDAQGRWEEAIAVFEQCLSIFIELGQITEQARAWKHIAISLHKGFTQGDFGPTVLWQAIGHCQSALDALESMVDPPSDATWLKGTVWNTLGIIRMNLRQWDEAIACYQQDLAICRALDDRFGMGLTYGNLGEVYQKRSRDNWPEALAAYQQALSIIREFDDRYEETEALANLAFLYQEMADYEQALDYYGQAIDIIEDLRAGILSEEARAGFFATIVDTYANAVLLCLEAGREAQAFDYVERARSRAFLDILAARSPNLSREMEATTITLTEVQAALPANALLLEYFTTGLVEAQEGRTPADPGAERHRFPPAKTLIFAITRDGLQVHDVSLHPNDLRPSQLDNVVERHFLDHQIRRTLYAKLIASVEILLRGRHRLYLVPHGPLHYIPFQALIAADGETLLREEGPQLVYAPSATLLFRYRQMEPAQTPTPCLALGYNGAGAARLRFAEEEARSIAQLTGGHALSGPRPKKATLYDQAPGYRLLHFSCHGDFDPDSPLASALHLAPGEALTALDVLEHLRLHCDLVTLSACESGLSRVRRGDELVGFIRAFIYAGAPTLISTLWRVDERSTRVLMEKFYQEVQTGVGFAEALKRAQLYLRDLTRKEALDVLVRFLADEILDSVAPPGERRSDLPVAEAVLQRADAYLKGLATKAGSDDVGRSLGEGDEERIFADPYYWAPFTLVGDHGSVSLERE
jgi:CHAT domain-containing protein